MYFVQFVFEKKLVTKYHFTLRGEDIEQAESIKFLDTSMYSKQTSNDHFHRKGLIG